MSDSVANQLLRSVFRHDISVQFDRGSIAGDNSPFTIANRELFSRRFLSPLPEELEYIDSEDFVHLLLAETQGIDTLACYKPYRLYGEEQWGIYLDIFAMNRFSVEIATKARILDRSVKNSEARTVTYSEVLRHELEHAIQELILAKAVARGFFDLSNIDDKKFNKTGSYRETLASHFEHLDAIPRVKGLEIRKVNLIRTVLSSAPAPRVYGEWKSRDVQQLDERYERELGIWSGGEPSSSIERRLVNGSFKSDYLTVPVYASFGNTLRLSLRGFDLRAQSVDCKKLMRFLKREGLGKHFSPDISVKKSSDHEVQIESPRSMPIKISCHDWDNVPDHVIGQIAGVVEMNRSPLVAKLRGLL